MGACLADGAKLRVTAMLSEDVAELLPYVNSVLKYATYNTDSITITFKYYGSPVILERRRVVVGQLADMEAAEDLLDRLLDYMRQVQAQRNNIKPVFSAKPMPQPLEIINLLPRSNCGQCGEPTCTAFALKLALGQQQAENCMPLTGEEVRRILSILDSLDNQQLIVNHL